ncbi:DUF4089 domain-containing protein [Hyphomicrobium sp.]|uniref:DUF4089 domain-containing protein n=1 Tax=Hyphomicrobium sp. TaxID=82 RepID=UPI0025C204D8|nr:DUF4089 domain-containing protein [Hyphomicrobium sp.]MCC7251753.1 DUF4089 domain-containing protein [Hyphomicrobium sp.]
MSADDTTALIEASAANLGLTIAPEWKPNVAMFIEVARGMARLVEGTGAAASAEAEPVLTPGATSACSAE